MIYRNPAIQAMRSQIDHANSRDLRQAYESTKLAFDSAELELTHAREALTRAARPIGVWASIAILGLIAASGMIFPLVIMAGATEPLTQQQRYTYAGIFVLAILAFFAYLTWEIYKVRKSVDGFPKSDQRSPDA